MSDIITKLIERLFEPRNRVFFTMRGEGAIIWLLEKKNDDTFLLRERKYLHDIYTEFKRSDFEVKNGAIYLMNCDAEIRFLENEYLLRRRELNCKVGICELYIDRDRNYDGTYFIIT